LSRIELKEKNMDGDYDYKILRLKVLKLAKMDDEALALIEDLLNSDPYNVRYCFFRADLFKKNEDRIEYLLKCNSNIEYSVELKNKILYECISYYEIHGKEYLDLNKAITIANDCISIDPSLDNDAYSFLFNHLKIKSLKSSLKQEGRDKVYSEIEELISKVAKINKTHSNYFNLKSRYTLLNANVEKSSQFHDEIISSMNKSSTSKKKFLYSKLSDDLLSYSISDKFFNEMKKAKGNNATNYNKYVDFYKRIDDFFEADLSFKKDVVKFMINKAKYIISKRRDIDYAIDICKDVLKVEGNLDFIMPIVEIFTFDRSETEMVEFIRDYVVDNKGKIDDLEYKLSMVVIFESLGDKSESLRILETLSDENKENYTFFMKKIYNCIISEKYDDAINFYKKNSELIKLFSQYERDILSLNYYLARKKTEYFGWR